MDEFLIHFLSKNKWPEVKQRQQSILIQLNKDETVWKQLQPAQIGKLSNTKNKTNQTYLALALYYLGWREENQVLTLITEQNDPGVVDLPKAEHWASQLGSYHLLVVLLICYLKQENMSYGQFVVKYHEWLESLNKISEVLPDEIKYRLLRLLSGWVQDHQEYELSQELLQLSEWVGVDECYIEELKIDQLINRWWSNPDRREELYLIQMVIGENSKLNYLINHRRSLNLVRRL